MIISYELVWFQDQVDAAVKVLLSLKADYKAATGKDWKPGTGPAKQQDNKPAQKQKTEDNMPATADSQQDLKAKIDQQGSKVRDLKVGGADKVKQTTIIVPKMLVKCPFFPSPMIHQRSLSTDS